MINARDDIKILLLKKHMTLTKLAEKMTEKMGKKFTQSGLSHKLSKNTVRYDELTVICEILGYEIEYKQKS